RPLNGGEPFFTPAHEREQLALGERLLDLFRSAGAEIVAEDLGTVPDFVRASLARLGGPGFRVLRWERRWHSHGQPFRDPSEYDPISVATSGTHDTETMMVWWNQASDEERHKLEELPTIQRITGGEGLSHAAGSTVRDALLETLFASGSNLLLL